MKTFTQLKDRILWYDGDITFTPDQLNEYFLRGGQLTDKLHVDALNFEVENFNKLHPSLKINVKESLNVLDQTWNIPPEYKKINIGKYVSEKFSEELDKHKDFSEKDITQRIERIEQEVSKYKEYDMMMVLRTMIYIVDVFKKYNVVWGTGRGSSCSSYILYLIGLHNVDSVKYELNLSEFFN